MAIHLADLLNPVDLAGQRVQASMQAGLVDIRPQLLRLSSFNREGVHATLAIQEQLLNAIEYLESQQHLAHIPVPALPPLPPVLIRMALEDIVAEVDVRLTRKTTLSKLYRYPPDAVLEYPETSLSKPTGHLFHLDPEEWLVPDLNIAYSRGEPMGRTLSGKEVFFDVMVNGNGEKVPCSESHSACQGVKVCPQSDKDNLAMPHTSASRANIQTWLRQDREDRLQYASPSKDIFCRTAAYLSAVRKLGCSRPLVEETLFSESEEEQKEVSEIYRQQGVCEGRIIFQYDNRGRPRVSCEHYDHLTSRDHFHDDHIGAAAGTYNLAYIKAVLTGNEEEVTCIEEAAFSLGYGPRVECTTVTNASSQRAICPHDHRDENGSLNQPLMERLECCVKFRVIEPLEEYRAACPYVLITSLGHHTHPIPLPTKTPPAIRSRIFQLLEELGDDIPDITPRRFLRHPILKAFLATEFRHTPQPTLSHLHISLANRSRIKAYIKQIKEIHCPEGTGWEAHHEEDDDDAPLKDNQLRIIVCMSPNASRRLLERSSYLQSDIAFKCIVDFLEFEMACMERDANTILGLYLQALAASMPLKADLHEPHRSLQSLTPYEHLHRLFRLCSNHYHRNITSCGVTQEVKGLMRDLLCMTHENWDGALTGIREKGRKAGNDWLRDKETTHFVFEAICWERSFIPEAIWRAGDSTTNFVESTHRDANREGVHCTLLGGLQKGQAFDALKLRTLEVFETYGIRPTYNSGHISENAFTNLRRRDNAQRKTLLLVDQQMETLNNKLQKSYEQLVKARHNILLKLQTNLAGHDISVAIQRLADLADRALAAHLKLVDDGKELEGRGTGKVAVQEYTLTPNGARATVLGTTVLSPSLDSLFAISEAIGAGQFGQPPGEYGSTESLLLKGTYSWA
ncbi:hypothetical protein B0H16DRAFT_1457764 [Mycena metata]|uniref:Uncharacterized protein n=1 Tax=Mycena metata TaxID=1033252 RepID=A0AAD7NEK3_9AGAR|nr:hypothetical protein B0H16DRAFT_1457764 [Mycena metata]